jgi:predicted transcriptional regulator
MKKQHTVLEVLFPQVRAEILRFLFTPPQKERYVRELARMSGLTLSTVQEELRRLSALKLVRSWSNRFHRFYRADRKHPLFADLVHMVDTSEKMPQLEHSAVHRQRNARPRRRKKARSLPCDRPMNWNLFSKGRQT